MHEQLSTPEAPPPVGPYSQAIRTDGLVFVSGQLGTSRSDDGWKLEEGIEEQAAGCIRNIIAVLGAAGLGVRDIVRTTVYLVDMADFARVNRVYERSFERPFPARVAVGIDALPAGALIEMDAVASTDRGAE